MKHSNKNIERLTQYRSILKRLKTMGFIKVFSDNLADAAGVSSSQVRKDFSVFGISGNKRGGYSVEALIKEINVILGKDRVHKVVVVGVGNIGKALINYGGFEKEHIKIVASFDTNSGISDGQNKVPILPLEELKNISKRYKVTVGVIAVPDLAAQHVADLMIDAGIQGILNFAPIHLRSKEGIVIKNVNLASELENIIYYVNNEAQGDDK